MKRLHPSCGRWGLRDVEIQIEALAKILGVAIGLRREIAGIHPNHWNVSASIHPAQQMEQHRGLDAEARG